MSLYDHAESELRLAGLLDKDSDYDGMLGRAVLELIEVFAKQGHSGFSAAATIELFTKLASYHNITPLSSDPREWNRVADEHTTTGPVWQNRRRSSTFSRDGGKTWYDIEDPSRNNGDVWDRTAADWTDVLIGNNVKVGSLVRCKVDAYSQGSGQQVNGVPGRVTAIRNGMLAVRHDNGQSFNHHVEVLQVART